MLGCPVVCEPAPACNLVPSAWWPAAGTPAGERFHGPRRRGWEAASQPPGRRSKRGSQSLVPWACSPACWGLTQQLVEAHSTSTLQMGETEALVRGHPPRSRPPAGEQQRQGSAVARLPGLLPLASRPPPLHGEGPKGRPRHPRAAGTWEPRSKGKSGHHLPGAHSRPHLLSVNSPQVKVVSWGIC